MVAVPDGFGTILYSPYSGLRPKAAPHNPTGGPHPLLESHLCSSDGNLLHIWASETIPWGQFQTRVGCILPQFVLSWLITTVIGVVLAVVLFSTPGGTHAIVMYLQWCFRQFSIVLVCAVPTADFGFSGFVMGPLTRSIIRGTIGGAILLCVLGIDEEPDEWMPWWWSADEENVSVWCTGLLVETRACGPQILEQWWPGGLCSSLHGGSKCLTHVTCGKSTRIGSGGDAPGKYPGWVNWTGFREYFQKGGVHLFYHPGLQFLMFSGHQGSLVLMLSGQFGPSVPIFLSEPLPFMS